MESVSWAALCAGRSITVAVVTPGKYRPARAGQIISRWPAARSTRPCAFIVAWPNRILTSSAHVHTIISSTHSQKSGVCAKPRKPSAKFMARPLRANSPCSRHSGPTVTNPNPTNAKSSSNGSMKTIRRDSLSPSDGERAGVWAGVRGTFRPFGPHTDFIPILDRFWTCNPTSGIAENRRGASPQGRIPSRNSLTSCYRDCGKELAFNSGSEPMSKGNKQHSANRSP